MTHDSAVRAVASLVPEIEKKGAAAVLTDYATKEDLPPAQLEKLAQVFNTLRTISHIDHADEDARGDSVEMLNVPELVTGYATGIGQEKAARNPDSAAVSHDASLVDLNRALRLEINPIEKAAAAPEEVEQVLEDTFTAAEAQEALLDLEIDLRDEMSKLAGQIFAAAEIVDTDQRGWTRDISLFEKEACYKEKPHLVKAAGDFMEEFGAPHRTKMARHDYGTELPARSFDTGTEGDIFHKFATLANLTGTYNEIVKMATSINDVPPTLQDLTPEDLAGIHPGAMGADPSLTPPAEGEEKEEESGLDQLEGQDAGGGGSPQSGDTKPPKSKDKKKGGGGDDGGSSKSKTEAPAAPAASGGGLGRVLGGTAKSTARAAAGAIPAGAAKLDQALSGITTKERQNKAQRGTDLDVNDIKRAMRLRRMIGTDPVLKEADPKEVLEVYNSIVERNPDLAGDMPSLRLLLREAVSYEGLTLDSQKLLSEIRRNSAQGEAAAEENEKRRYSVGGASPISLTTK